MYLLAAKPRVGHHENAPVPDTDNEGLAFAAQLPNSLVTDDLPPPGGVNQSDILRTKAARNFLNRIGFQYGFQRHGDALVLNDLNFGCNRHRFTLCHRAQLVVELHVIKGFVGTAQCHQIRMVALLYNTAVVDDENDIRVGHGG